MSPISPTPSNPRSRCAATGPSCRGRTCAARGPRSGTSRWPISTTPTRPSTRPATASRPSGRSWTARASCFAPHGFRAPRWRRPRPWTVAGVELSMEALGALADGAAAEAALRPLVAQYRDWIEARRTDIAISTRLAARDGGGAAALRWHRRRSDRARHRCPGQGCRRPRRFPRGEPRRSSRTSKAAQDRGAALARLPARLPTAQPAGPRRPARSEPRDGGPALLPDRRRQDRGVSWPRRLCDGAEETAPSRARRGSRAPG